MNEWNVIDNLNYIRMASYSYSAAEIVISDLDLVDLY